MAEYLDKAGTTYLIGKIQADLINFIYPVGSVVVSVNQNYDPNKLYSHQTWVRFAKGQTLVGVDEADTAFSTAEKTGGEKAHTLTTAEMPKHSHVNNISLLRYTNSTSYNALGTSKGPYTTLSSGGTLSTNTTGESNAHNNLQPYTTVYYWKRTS